VSEAHAILLPAVHSAVEELRRARVRFEVYARVGESVHRRRHGDGSWERRSSREVGVSCRVAGGGRCGFAASSGSSARAGREAARSALATLLPGVDPLPPREALGCLAVPARPRPTRVEELDEVAGRFADALTTHGDRLRVLDLRVIEGISSSLLTTAEGFSCGAEAGAGVVEVLLAPRQGPLRHVHWAARTVRELRPDRLVPPLVDRVLTLATGARVRRQLADVVVAPAIAAPLVAALAGAVAAGAYRDDRPKRATGAAWHVVDERAGPRALLPLPCDGEGLPVRRIEVLAGGRPVGQWTTWVQAQKRGVTPGGAVRPSYQEEPRPGPANLVVLAAHRRSREELLAALDRGFLLEFPAGELRISGGVFALRAGALSVAGGRPTTAHPLVELRGSVRRLLAAFAAAGDDDGSFSHECVVTTPSLLLRGLEIA